jgi:hypothetical protein
MKSINISIPKPCHEDWEKMTKNEQGKFCNLCAKTVIDFTQKSIEEIKSILSVNAGTKLCGRFKNEQLSPQKTYIIDVNLLPINLSFKKAVRLAILVVFFSTLFSCSNHNNEKILGEISTDTSIISNTNFDTLNKPIQPENNNIENNKQNVILTGDVVVEEKEFTKGEVKSPNDNSFKDSLNKKLVEPKVNVRMGAISCENSK